jgi:hypothetical protein
VSEPAYTRLDVSKQAYLAATLEQAAAEPAQVTAPDPALRAAVRGWPWFVDGALLHWLEHRDMQRERLHALLLGTLVGAVAASGGSL